MEFPAPLPSVANSRVAVPPPGPGAGHWAGAPTAVLADGVYWLAYRLRGPLGEGRGYANVVARSEDGERFTPVAVVTKERFGAESLERPSLVLTPQGRWRLYVSAATPGTKHWRVEVLEADDPAGLAGAPSRVVMPGDADWGVKDPVLVRADGGWHAWATWHPLESWDDADRMVTRYATSPDGLTWTWRATALTGRPGAWDARGARVAWVLPLEETVVAYYDGRASAGENYEERTGLATGSGFASFAAHGAEPAASSPHRSGGLRYLCVLALPDGGWRMYYELTRADGAHELRTEVVAADAEGTADEWVAVAV